MPQRQRRGAPARAAGAAEEVLSLPIFPSLTGGRIERIGDALRECSIRIRNSGAAL
jgi:dTDP-4-amino-4,6-dideoxygalactose transaminase